MTTPRLSDLCNLFSEIHQKNAWGNKESVSGSGSTLDATWKIRVQLPSLMEHFDIHSVLDLPCGDRNWMKEVFIPEYIGADIVPGLIERNRRLWPDLEFHCLDATTDPLPKVDLVLMRDLLGHLSLKNAFKVVDNLKRSGSKYLLATSFTRYHHNPPNPQDGGWYCINLMVEPFCFNPIALINEGCQEGDGYSYNDKCLILFDLRHLVAGRREHA